MTPEERQKLQYAASGAGECLRDPARHIIVSIGWKPLGGLLNLLFSVRDAAKNMEQQLSRLMQPFGYENTGKLQKTIGGTTAEGFGYTYRAKDTAMYAQSLAVKHGRTIYYLHVYVRTDRKDESLAVWDELLSGMRWAD
jgi:hypothetical protein